MKLGQLIQYDKRNNFFENYTENEAGETSSRSLFIFKKSLIWGKKKESGLQLSFNIFR